MNNDKLLVWARRAVRAMLVRILMRNAAELQAAAAELVRR